MGISWLCLVFFSVTTYGHFTRDLKGNQINPVINLDASWTEPIQGLYVIRMPLIPMVYFV